MVICLCFFRLEAGPRSHSLSLLRFGSFYLALSHLCAYYLRLSSLVFLIIYTLVLLAALYPVVSRSFTLSRFHALFLDHHLSSLVGLHSRSYSLSSRMHYFNYTLLHVLIPSLFSLLHIMTPSCSLTVTHIAVLSVLNQLCYSTIAITTLVQLVNLFISIKCLSQMETIRGITTSLSLEERYGATVARLTPIRHRRDCCFILSAASTTISNGYNAFILSHITSIEQLQKGIKSTSTSTPGLVL